MFNGRELRSEIENVVVTWPSRSGTVRAFYNNMDQTAICYEHILRAIGQGLQSLSLEPFDLEIVNDNTFLVQGTPAQNDSGDSNPAKLNMFKEAFLSICKTSKTLPPAATQAARVPGLSHSVRLQFTKSDIDKLEREGQALRSDWEHSPLSHSLSQVLRTVGWYVDQKKGHLQRISKNGDTVRVSYTAALGMQKTESLTLLQIYDMWVHLFKQRKGTFGNRSPGCLKGDV